MRRPLGTALRGSWLGKIDQGIYIMHGSNSQQVNVQFLGLVYKGIIDIYINGYSCWPVKLGVLNSVYRHYLCERLFVFSLLKPNILIRTNTGYSDIRSQPYPQQP